MRFGLVLALVAFLSCQSAKQKETPAAPVPAPPGKEGTVQPVSTAKPAKPGELLNRVRYIVGDEPITDMDIDAMKKNLVRMGRPIRNLQEDSVKELIRRALVENEARTESIVISETRIDNEVSRAKEAAGIKDDVRFRATVEQETGMPYALWLENMKYDLIKQQLIQIKVTVPQPTQEELRRFYNQNAGKAGQEVRYREIVLQPQNATLEEEARISQLARQIADRSRGNPQLFAELARTTPDNVSPAKLYGGAQDYQSLAEVAAVDRITAGILANLGVGQTSMTFRDSRGRYVLLYMEDRRPVVFEKVEDKIRQRLFYEKAEQAFEDWIDKKRKETAIISVE